ncbi:NAD-P-binding protein [Amylocystis lapponica]|nr:NAD-P-binding protein [Amylocystis lapponica]
MDAQQKVWFITGTSSGFGRRLAHIALARGDLVIATVRRREDFDVPEANRERVHVLVMDVTEGEKSIQQKVNEALAVWGRIDVLVNNAAAGSKILLQEASPETVSNQFQINVLGAFNVTNAILPSMRKRRVGQLVFMGSRAAFRGNTPLGGLYIASKAALHTLAETYAAELRPFDVKVMIVAPGSFRTENVFETPVTADHPVGELDQLRTIAAKRFDELAHEAQGDPQKAMELLADVVRGEGQAKGRPMPRWLFMGSATYDAVQTKCEEWGQALNEWADTAKDLDYDK